MKGKITKKMLRRRAIRFYAILGGVALLFAVGCLIGVNYLKGELSEYESVQPVHAAEEALTLFENRDFDALYAYEDASRYPSQTDYVSYLGAHFAQGAVTQSEFASGDRETKKYVVYLDGEAFAEYYLRQSDERSIRGYRLWKLDTVAVTAIETVTYRIRAREDSVVYMDGVALTDADKVETGISTGVQEFLPEDIPEPTECVYGVSVRLREPTFTATDAKGRAQSYLADEDGTLVFQNIADELDDAVKETVTLCGKCIALYTSDDKDFIAMGRFLYKDSKAYKRLLNLETGWYPLHSGYAFDASRVENAHFYSDKIFSCDMYTTFRVTLKSGVVNEYNIAYTFYFIKSGDNWLLYDMNML